MTGKTDWTGITRAYARRVLRDRGFAAEVITDGIRQTQLGNWQFTITSEDGNTSAVLANQGDAGWGVSLTDLTAPDRRFEAETVVWDHATHDYAEVVVTPPRKDDMVIVVYAPVWRGDDVPRDPARMLTVAKNGLVPSGSRPHRPWAQMVPAAVALREGRSPEHDDALDVPAESPAPEVTDDGPGELHAQFCLDGNDITTSPYAATDATEVRIWTEDSMCIVAAQRNRDTRAWHVSASDVCDWTVYADTPYRSFSAAFDAPFAQDNRPVWLAIQRALSA
jgi:hypothetical protein